MQEYSNNITFFLSGKYFFYSPYRYQPKYILCCNTFGCSLPNADFTKVFGRIPKGKGKAGKAKGDISCPLTPEELHSIIDTGHLPEIYNVINFWTYEFESINQYECAATSRIKVAMIWSLRKLPVIREQKIDQSFQKMSQAFGALSYCQTI